MEETAGSSHRPLVFGTGETPISFVSVEDVSALVVRTVEDPSLRGRVLEICGPEPVSMRDLASRVMRHRSWSGRPRRVPRPLLHAMALTVGVLKPSLGRQARAGLAMDRLPTRLDDALRSELPELPCTAVSDVVSRS
jgi:NADH dehydrogenase